MALDSSVTQENTSSQRPGIYWYTFYVELKTHLMLLALYRNISSENVSSDYLKYIK